MGTVGSFSGHGASHGQRQDLNPGSLHSEHIDWKNGCVYGHGV